MKSLADGTGPGTGLICGSLKADSQGVVIGLASVMLVLPPLAVPKYRAPVGLAANSTPLATHRPAHPLPTRVADFAAHPASPDARYIADWVADSRDNAGAPFVILDKRDARVFVFDADARLIDTSPVLLGLAVGDDSVPDIGLAPDTPGSPGRAHHAGRPLRQVASWVREAGENQARPFAIVDKRQARIHVFEADGRSIGDSAVLLGQTPGDGGTDLGSRHPYSLDVAERTTPAGRFASRPGHNDKGDAIVWIDCAAALAIHRLRPAPAHQRRPERLESPAPDDNRISLGCVIRSRGCRCADAGRRARGRNGWPCRAA